MLLHATRGRLLLGKGLWVFEIQGLVPKMDVMGQHGDLGLVAPSWCLQQLGSEVAGVVRTSRKGPAIVGPGAVKYSIVVQIVGKDECDSSLAHRLVAIIESVDSVRVAADIDLYVEIFLSRPVDGIDAHRG